MQLCSVVQVFKFPKCIRNKVAAARSDSECVCVPLTQSHTQLKLNVVIRNGSASLSARPRRICCWSNGKPILRIHSSSSSIKRMHLVSNLPSGSTSAATTHFKTIFNGHSPLLNPMLNRMFGCIRKCIQMTASTRQPAPRRRWSMRKRWHRQSTHECESSCCRIKL